MNKYKYMFIDAQILLTTGVYAVMHSSPGGKVSKNDLLRMFILSIFKLVREVKCDRPFLVWDSSPYHKNAILKELLGQEDYKGDRGYKTEDDITSIKLKIEETYNKIAQLQEEDPFVNDAQISELQEQISKWEKQINDIDVQISNFKTRSDAKYFIIQELQNFGFTSIILKSWECDDLCTLIADYCNEHKIKAVLVSKDSDYDFMLNPYVDKYNHLCKKLPSETDPNPKLITFEQVSKYWWWVERDFPDKKLYEVKALMDSAWGSHNALHKTVKPEWCKPGIFLKDALDKGEEAFSDFNLFKAQLETFNFSRYPKYEFAKECLPWYLKIGKLGTIDEFKKFLKDNNINVSSDGYKNIINILDYECYN